MKKYLYVIISFVILMALVGISIWTINKNNKSHNVVAEIQNNVNTVNSVNSNQEEVNNVEIASVQTENNTEEEKINMMDNDDIENKETEDNKPKEKNETKKTEQTNTNIQQEQKIQTQENKEEQNQPIEQEPIEEPKPEQQVEQQPEQKQVQLDFSKYDRHYPALNGGYKCFKKNPEEIAKLKSLLEDAIREFGYENIKLVEDSSIVSDRYFTANKTNAQNVVYNADGFTIHYYAETEYGLTADGNEFVFQLRSYTKITGQ